MAVTSVVAVQNAVEENRQTECKHHKGFYEKYVKRPMDFFLASGALIALSPVIAGTAIAVRTKLGSPVLFIQDRPGKDERIFRLYKFRTMTDSRDEKGEPLPDEVRLTKLGKLLRGTSLDELPELMNILKGDMSIIGPRPLLVQYLPYYTEIEKHRHDVRPGLSGFAQVNGRNLVKWDQRLAMDVEYVKKITFVGDVTIILKTIKKVFAKEDIAIDTVTVEPYLDEERRGNCIYE